MVTCDGARASHDLIARLDKLAARPGYQRICSVGWELAHGSERPSPCRTLSDQHQAVPATRKGAPGARGTPATRPGSRAAAIPQPETRPINSPPDLASPGQLPRESSRLGGGEAEFPTGAARPRRGRSSEAVYGPQPDVTFHPGEAVHDQDRLASQDRRAAMIAVTGGQHRACDEGRAASKAVGVGWSWPWWHSGGSALGHVVLLRLLYLVVTVLTHQSHW